MTITNLPFAFQNEVIKKISIFCFQFEFNG